LHIYIFSIIIIFSFVMAVEHREIAHTNLRDAHRVSFVIYETTKT